MALLFAESFDGYELDQITKKWSLPVALYDIQSGEGQIQPRRPGNKFFMTNGFATAFRPGSRRLFFGFATTGHNTWDGNFKFRPGFDNRYPLVYGHVNLGKVGNEIQLSDSAGAVIYTTPSMNVFSDLFTKWSYIELMVYTDANNASAGEVELRLNGETLFSATNVLTGQAPTYMFGIEGSFDDMYICDDTGYNNTFLGPLFIDIIRPNGVGDSTIATGNNGAKQNWEHVNDLPPLNHDEYVDYGGADANELYQYEDIGTDKDVFGLLFNTFGSKSNSGQSTRISALAKPTAAVTEYGASRGLSTSYNYDFYVGSDTNPDTGVSWTCEEVNASQFGWRSLRE